MLGAVQGTDPTWGPCWDPVGSRGCGLVARLRLWSRGTRTAARGLGFGGGVLRKVVMFLGRWQCPQEGGSVLRMVEVSLGRWQCPQEGGNVLVKVVMFPGR